MQLMQSHRETLKVEYLERIMEEVNSERADRISKTLCGSDTSIEVQDFTYGSTLNEISNDKTESDTLDTGSYFVPSPLLFQIRDSLTVTQFGLLKIDSFASIESLFHFPGHKISFVSRTKKNSQEFIELNVPEPSAEISFAYSVQSGIQENYYHWLVIVLSKLNSRFIREKSGPNPILIFSPFDNEIQKQSANIMAHHFGLSYLNIEQETTLRIKNLLYPAINRWGGVKPEPLVKETFSILKNYLYDSNGYAFKKIYISRKDSNNRVMRNEEQVEHVLESRFGFKIIELSGKSLADQINLFSRASFIISPHGAGLTNIGFCQPGSAVLELHMPNNLIWCYRRLSCLNNLRYGFLYGQNLMSSSNHSSVWSFEICLNELSKSVSQMEDELG